MEQWYYSQDGQQLGPISEEELRRLLEEGSLSSESLLWCEGMPEWLAADEIERLSPLKDEGQQLVVSHDLPRWHYEPSGEQARPWVRYWARGFDISLFGIGIGVLLGLFYAPALEINDAVLGIIIVFIYIFAEALMLTIWGITPGKALLKVRLRNGDDSRLTYAQAMSRSFKVWLYGLGCGLPIVKLITHINAYNKLNTDGITSWDAEGGYTVSHQEIGAWRLILAVLVLAAVVAVMIYGQMEG
jgi:hypothetical protein